MKKVTKITLLFFTLLTSSLQSSVYAIITYQNTDYGLGIPALGTYIYLTDGRTLSEAYRSGNYWILDDYRFSVENANVTVDTIFDSPNMVLCTVHGTGGQESTLKVDASYYGYTHKPQTITYTGQVINIYWRMEGTELQLYATHETTGNLIYEINWEGISGIGGVSPSNPKYWETEPQETWQETPIITPKEPAPTQLITKNKKTIILVAFIAVILILAFYTIKKLTKPSTQQRYRKLTDVRPKRRR